MKNNILLSYIVPVYNVEEYLRECVDSIRDQMTDQCEIILVNDGSTDSSADICKEYAEADSRITFINQINSGVAVARNIGMSLAKGEYVAFVDSDDRISKDSIKHILELISHNIVDICFLDGIKFYPSGESEPLGDCIIRASIKGKSREEALMHLASRPKYSGSACTKIFRKQFLKKNDIKFSQGRCHGEDLTFCRECFLNAESFDSIDVKYYEYRQKREGSATHSVTSRSFHQLASFVVETAQIIDNKPLGVIEKCVMSFAAYEYTILLWQYSCLQKEDQKESICFLKEWKWVLKYSKNTRGKFISYFVTLFGVKFVSAILNLYMSNFRKAR